MKKSLVFAAPAVLFLMAVGPSGHAWASGTTAKVAPLDAYGQLPGVDDVDISPNGTRIAMAITVKGKRRILVMDNKSRVLRMESADGMKIRSLQFAGDDRLILQRSATKKVSGYLARQYELYQAVVIPVDRSKTPWAIFSNSTHLSNSEFGMYGIRRLADGWHAYLATLAYDRERLTNTFNFTNGRPFLYDVNLQNRDSRRVGGQAQQNWSRDWLMGPNGKVAARLDQSNETGQWTIKNAAGKTLASGKTLTGNVDIYGFGPEPGTLIYSADEKTERPHNYQVPLAGGEAKPFLPDKNIAEFFLAPNSNRIIGYEEEKPGALPVYFDPGRQHVAKLLETAFAGKNFDIYAWSNDMSDVIVHTDGDEDSGTWYYVDVGALRASPFGYDRPQILPNMVGPISLVHYTAQDGMALDGVLTLPPGRKARDLPVILLPHGGPHDEDTVHFDWWAQAFASRGYAVFQPNFRGSTGHGAAYEAAGYGQWGRKMQTDISDGLAYLAKQGIVNPKRACIMGGSYGGYAALAGVTLQHGIYRCAVSVAGVADVAMTFHTDYYQSGDSTTLEAWLQRELGPRSGWKAISPRDHAAEADAPILLIAGHNDTVVPYQQTQKMADALRKAGKTYKLVDLGAEDHWLSHGDTREKMLQAAMAWVEKYNPSN